MNSGSQAEGADEKAVAPDPREKLLTLLLRVCAGAGAIAYVPSAYLSVKTGLWIILLLDTLLFAFVIIMALRPDISFRFRAVTLVVSCYILGVCLVIFTGPYGAGYLFIFMSVFLVALFWRLRQIIAVNALAIVTNIGLAIASSLHAFSWPDGTESLLVIAANFTLVSLILSFAANYLIRGYSASAREERRMRQTLELMLQEVEHRVKNNLQVISSLIRIRSRSPEGASQAIADIQESLQAISVVHQLLYREDSAHLVDVAELFSMLVQRFRITYKDHVFSLGWEGAHARIDGDRAISLGILINEILLNSVKHAFAPGLPGRVALGILYEERERRLHIRVEDDGKGMEEDASTPGKGIKIIKAVAKQLDASMSIKSENGVRYEFDLRIPVPTPR